MKKIKIYFWKHGFQTDGVSLWVVQVGRKKFLTKEIECLAAISGKFQNKNPHAYFEVIKPTLYAVSTSAISVMSLHEPKQTKIPYDILYII